MYIFVFFLFYFRKKYYLTNLKLANPKYLKYANYDEATNNQRGKTIILLKFFFNKNKKIYKIKYRYQYIIVKKKEREIKRQKRFTKMTLLALKSFIHFQSINDFCEAENFA